MSYTRLCQKPKQSLLDNYCRIRRLQAQNGLHTFATRLSHSTRTFPLKLSSRCKTSVTSNSVANAPGRLSKWLSSSPFTSLRSDNAAVRYGAYSLLGGCSLYTYSRYGPYANVVCEGRAKLSHKSRTAELKEAKDDAKFDWQMMWYYVKADLWLLLLAAGAAFAVAWVNIQVPILLGGLVNSITELISRQQADGAVDQGASVFGTLYEPCKRLLYTYGLQSAFTFLYITLLSAFGERMAARMRSDLFASLMHQDISFFDTHRTGEILTRLSSDIQDFKSSFKQVISQGLRSSTMIIGSVCSLYSLSPKLTALMIVVLPGVIIVGTGLGSLLRQLSAQAQMQVGVANSIADEAIGNIRTVRAFAMEGKEIGWFQAEVEKSQTLSELLGAGIGAFQGLSNLAINSIVLVVLYTGTVLIDGGEIGAGDLMSYLVTTQTLQRSLANMSILFGQVVRGMSAGARVFEYMTLQPTIRLTGGIRIPLDELDARIGLSSVGFSYPSRAEQVVLQDLSLRVAAGKTLALVGSSGSGKSTIVAILERFYDVDRGEVSIGGHNIKELDPSWLRSEVIGYINQEPVLFATSVMENIRYGCPSATDAEVYEAAKNANADEFIRSFPKGYHTVVGERGATVSGGQKQRIAIARALLKNPKILILDEATSALDTESERVVQEALDRLAQGRTVVIVAHRLSTIQNADMIAVVSKGRIVELGTHNELLDKEGAYYELTRRQALGISE